MSKIKISLRRVRDSTEEATESTGEKPAKLDYLPSRRVSPTVPKVTRDEGVHGVFCVLMPVGDNAAVCA